jgi:cyclopropane-fatty-acyl-phospholipid synthase
MLLDGLLRHMVREGTLTVVGADGRRSTYGDGGPPRCTIRLADKAIERWVLVNPTLRVGEAYMDGRIDVVDGSLRDFLAILLNNKDRLLQHRAGAPTRLLQHLERRVKQHNPVHRARRNVAHHYDLSGALYELFLDRDRQYSCGYFENANDDLEAAQHKKKRHIAAKLLLDRRGLKVLDIGSGWGGLGIYLAGLGDVDVTGVTLSTEQHRESQRRAEAAGLDRRCRFHLRDYREERGPYDRIVSVGMFEHVGRRNYQEFFDTVRGLLADDGVCLLHSIGRFDEPGPINPFIRKYIFPGADLPALSEVFTAVERSGLRVTDVEILRLHYAETLRHWFERVQANRGAIAELYDERFCRMWEMYLAGCEMGFRHRGLMVFQMQLARRQDAVPLTRDYIVDRERTEAAGPTARSAAE